MTSADPTPQIDSPADDKITTTGQYLALTAALLGWMFDGAEMGLFSLVGRPAIKDLLGASATEGDIGRAFGAVIAIFLVGAATGGVLFGWLGDRIGRVRAMSFSVLVYALFTGMCGFATAPWQIAVLRFIASLGMGGEWALGVALVMEVWPNRSRPFMAGLIGAAANVGYLVVGVAGVGLISMLGGLEGTFVSMRLSPETAKSLVSGGGWRIMMMLGAVPAVLTLFFRLFVPESHKWEAEQEKGTTSSWETADLLGVLIGAAGPLGVIYVWWDKYPLWISIPVTIVGIAVAIVGYTWPVLRFIQRQHEKDIKNSGSWQGVLGMMLLGASLSGVALLGTWGAVQWAPTWANQMIENEARAGATAEDPITPEKISSIQKASGAKEYTLILTSLGACLGCVLAALAGDWFGRRVSYCVLCLSSLGASLALYQLNTSYGNMFLFCVLLQGVCTASFYGWLPLYLPELFGTSVRATGQGFAFNFGRIMAAVGALNAGALVDAFGGNYPLVGSIMSGIYLVGVAIIWLAPETLGKDLPE